MTNPTSAQGYQPTLYYVRSSQDAARFYTVATDTENVLRCECKAGRYSRRPCRHVKAVVAGTVAPATLKTPTPTKARISESARRVAAGMEF